MREIKFRFWDTKKQMMSGSPIAIVSNSNNYFLVRDYETRDLTKPLFKPEKTSRFIPMQYTGLKDKNGKEIYDKDLVKICFIGYPDAKIKNWRYKVEAIYQVNIGLFQTTMDMVKLITPEMMINHIHFEAEDYWWDGETFKIDSKYNNGEKARSEGELEIIGNIYENADLLK